MDAILSAKLINVAAAAMAGMALFLDAGTNAAHASNEQLVAEISISTQTMYVSIDGQPAYAWKVSTAGRGYVTPKGSFKPTRTQRCGTRRSTTTRRCRIPCSSTAATRFMEPTPSSASAVRPRMAAFGCTRAMHMNSTRW